MNRRSFLTRSLLLGAAATAPGLIVSERRFWQLDHTMTAPPPFDEDVAIAWMREKIERDLELIRLSESLTPPTTPLLDRIPPYSIVQIGAGDDREIAWWNGSQLYRWRTDE